MLSADHSSSIAVTLTDAKGSTETGTVPIPASPGVAEDIDIPFSALTLTLAGGETAFDWTQVSSQFILDAEADLNFHLDQIGTDGPVPEPFAMAIWALTGLGGLGMVRVCRNRREGAAG